MGNPNARNLNLIIKHTIHIENAGSNNPVGSGRHIEIQRLDLLEDSAPKQAKPPDHPARPDQTHRYSAYNNIPITGAPAEDLNHFDQPKDNNIDVIRTMKKIM